MTARLAAAWVATRAVLLALLVVPRIGYGLASDVHAYQDWARGIADWSRVPYRDYVWEYPPGAAAVITPPAWFGDAYAPVFILLMVLADIAALAVLVRLGGRLGSARGAWVWLLGTAAVGPLLYARFDVVSALLAVVAVLALAGGAPVAAGIALGGGVATKLWPAVLLVAAAFVPRGRRLVLACAATLAATALAVVATGGAEHGGETFTRHARRGLQVEAVLATPYVVAQRAGAGFVLEVQESSGSVDVTGADAALPVSTALTLVALAGVAVLARRTPPEAWLDLAAVALLLLTVTGKVLSPQYLIWVLALLAAALCRRGSPLLLPAVLVGVAAVASQVVFPAYYYDLVKGEGLLPVAALVVRNALLVAAAAIAVRRVAVSR